MASLLGKADSTLISAARSEAMADVPADLSDIYEKRADNFSDFVDMITEQFDKKKKEEKDKKEEVDVFQERVNKAIEQGKQNDAYSKVMTDRTLVIAEEVKNYKGDKNTLEYQKIQVKIQSLAAVSESNAETWQKVISSDISTIGSGSEVDLFLQMLNDQSHNLDDSNIRWDEDKTDFVYTLYTDPKGEKDDNNPIITSMTISELEKRLSQIDPTASTAAQKVLNSIATNVNKRPWDESHKTDKKNALLKTMKTANERHNIMIEHFPGTKYSFWEALGGLKDPKLQKEMFDVLDALPGIGLDIDGDGNKDTRKMYLNADNHWAIMQAIKNSHHGNEILADWLIKNTGDDLYTMGENSRGKSSDEYALD